MDTPNNNPMPNTPAPSQDQLVNQVKDPTLMGILAYLGPLVIVSYLLEKDNAFVKFHVKQGFILLIIEVILWVITPMFFWDFWTLIRIVHLALTILSIIGIVNVVQKKQKMLPVVGSLARYFKF